jgi:hypothetical protein
VVDADKCRFINVARAGRASGDRVEGMLIGYGLQATKSGVGDRIEG